MAAIEKGEGLWAAEPILLEFANAEMKKQHLAKSGFMGSGAAGPHRTVQWGPDGIHRGLRIPRRTATT